MQNYNKLMVWSKAHDFTLYTYRLTSHFPKEEVYALVSQMRRAVSSIPMNIAEGCGRKSKADFAHFLTISLGSSNEIDYQFLLAKDLKYITEEEFHTAQLKVGEIRAMLISLINKVRQ